MDGHIGCFSVLLKIGGHNQNAFANRLHLESSVIPWNRKFRSFNVDGKSTLKTGFSLNLRTVELKNGNNTIHDGGQAKFH